MSAGDFNKNRRNRGADLGEFARLLTYDKFRRTNVLTDAEMSAAIKRAAKNDDNNFGRGGYFSTGDIPLDKDVIAYKVSVFSGDDEHVGVLRDTHRVTYNLPILADFSIIQDTVEPAKEVARRIIKKLREKGKITEEEERKYKEEIDKVTKTSELKKKLLGNVKVRYVDENGNRLTLQDDTNLGEKLADGDYLVKKDQMVGTDYDVTGNRLATLTTTDNKHYVLRSVSNGLYTDSASARGIIGRENTVVTYTYFEGNPIPGKALVHFKKQEADNMVNLANQPDMTLTGVSGESFNTRTVDDKVADLKKLGYSVVKNDLDTKSIIVDAIADEEGKDPSQVFEIVVKENVVDVTEPKTPNDPVDPTIPGIPVYPEPGTPTDPNTPEPPVIPYVPGYTSETPKDPTKPVNPDPEVPINETGKREELPNTGTEANAGLDSAGIMTLLAGLGLGFFRKKEDEK